MATRTATFLKNIIDRKYEEIHARQQVNTLDSLRKSVKNLPVCRSFVGAIEAKLEMNCHAVIAEIKKSSPSKGVIREHFIPSEIAKSYESGGAACLSVLTDVDFFQGDDAYVKQAREVVALPVMRKDFIVDEYQVYESRKIGADCILLIVAALTKEKLYNLNALAVELGMDVLVEVHDETELQIALTLPNKLIGINNRSLHTFDVSLQTTCSLQHLIPGDRIVVTESGISTREHVDLMNEHGIHCFLVGESFMRAEKPGEKLQELFDTIRL
jgi:indole-3-glycerol phosphate synthase